jgi:hypothetical protein
MNKTIQITASQLALLRMLKKQQLRAQNTCFPSKNRAMYSQNYFFVA